MKSKAKIILKLIVFKSKRKIFYKKKKKFSSNENTSLLILTLTVANFILPEVAVWEQ